MKKPALLIGLTACSLILLWHQLPIQDSPHYFAFADQTNHFGIPHTFDVLSNLAFFFAGVFGLLEVAKNWKNGTPALAVLGSVLALSSILVCIGSAYFHWNPNPETLIWDRIPMTIGFAAVAAIAVADRVNQKWGLLLFSSLVPFGALSLIGYANGFLSLRPYMLLQFGSLLFILLTIVIYRQGTIRNSMYSTAVVWYLIAKVFEEYDTEILNATGIVSGHTVKHICAAIAIFWLMTFYRTKKPSSARQSPNSPPLQDRRL